MAKKQNTQQPAKKENGPRESTALKEKDLVKVAASLQELSSRMRALAGLVADLPDGQMRVKSWKRFSEDLQAVIDISNKFHTAYNRAVLAGVPGFESDDDE